MTEQSSAPAAHWINDIAYGARCFVPMAISVAAYGLVWGVLARGAGLSIWEVMLTSGLVFAGSAQFVALDLWTTNPAALPIGAIVLAALIINLRYILMTATMTPVFAGMTPRSAALLSFFVTDESWAMTMGQVSRGRATPGFLLGAGGLAWLAWMAATTSGRLLGNAIDDPARFGLDFAFVAAFLALLIGMWRGRSDLLPWLVAALAALAASVILPDKWYILVGGLVGSLVGAWMETRKARHVA